MCHMANDLITRSAKCESPPARMDALGLGMIGHRSFVAAWQAERHQYRYAVISFSEVLFSRYILRSIRTMTVHLSLKRRRPE